MQDLTVSLVQTNQYWEDKAKNIKMYSEMLNSVSHTDLIVLPEMFHTGFTMNVKGMAESKEKGDGMEWLKRTAFEKNAAIYTSLILKEGTNYYNSGVFVLPTGDVKIYNKRKSFCLANEDLYFKAGEEEIIVDYLGWKFQLQICYDLRFPELVRNRIKKDLSPAYDAIIYVANWPERRSLHWKSLLQARAIENQCYVLGVNRIGHDFNDLSYSGASRVVDPLGIETIIPNNEKQILTTTISSIHLSKTRESLPFLKDQ